MKKIAIITTLFFCFFATAKSQEEVVPSTKKITTDSIEKKETVEINESTKTNYNSNKKEAEQKNASENIIVIKKEDGEKTSPNSKVIPKK